MFGTEVLNVDVATMDADVATSIDALLSERLLLLFRDQNLTPADQERCARWFGPLQDRPDVPEDAPEDERIFMVIGNRPAEGQPGVVGDGDMAIHVDQSYKACPVGLGLLYALAAPSGGGETRLVDAEAAYDALSDSVRRELVGATVEQVWNYDASAGPSHEATLDLTSAPSDNARLPSFAHPAVIQSPRTGRPALFVNRLQSRRLTTAGGIDRPDLLAELVEHMEDPRFEFDHAWQVGDLVIWDNMSLLHGRREFDPSEPRILRRVSVRGTQPTPADV
jgi:taurine dioxygenase